MLDRILSLGPNTEAAVRMPVEPLYEHVDATKVGAYCAFWTEVSYCTENSRRRSGAAALPSLKLAHAPIVNAACGLLADDVMVHLRIRSSKTRQR